MIRQSTNLHPGPGSFPHQGTLRSSGDSRPPVTYGSHTRMRVPDYPSPDMLTPFHNWNTQQPARSCCPWGIPFARTWSLMGTSSPRMIRPTCPHPAATCHTRPPGIRPPSIIRSVPPTDPTRPAPPAAARPLLPHLTFHPAPQIDATRLAGPVPAHRQPPGHLSRIPIAPLHQSAYRMASVRPTHT